ncbi:MULTISPECIES: XRE family transcriptional regulator [unclassified Streptomyces]|uniref:XRE family transcriptional regulator n=1 Tax=unclassified Streptomyces TaxID=2593676 RepID=UPI001E3F4F51|nr:XRE family transcriptional regulator [Streptomyces sp. CB02980]MCB8907012.1 RICIN domain-containing protein [Streptomyces sp. CB02980]
MAADRSDDMEPALVLGRALRDLQRRSGRTLRALEESVRISDSSLSRYFCGSTVPPWSTVHDLCRALDGDPADFRHLWEAADRGQRRPVQADRAGQRDAVPPPPVTGGDPAGDAPSEGAPKPRPSLRNGRTAWALAGTVLGLVLGAGGVVLVRPSAPAPGDDAPPVATHGTSATREHDRIFVSRATGACLDDSLDKGTRSFPCNGMPYQRWTVHTTADGGTQLRNHATGECLDHGADGLRTGPCGPAASQRWTVSAGSDSSFEVRSTATRRCLDDSPEGLRVLSCDRTVRQRWA